MSAYYYKLKAIYVSEMSAKITEGLRQVLDDWRDHEKTLGYMESYYFVSPTELDVEHVAAEMTAKITPDLSAINFSINAVTEEEYQKGLIES